MAHWVEHDAHWYEERMVHCSCCGRLIARDVLISEFDGKEERFCGSACEQLYRDYLLPVRGAGYHPDSDVHERYERATAK